MPAFSFEKLSPPVRREPVPSAPVKPRGLIHQMLDRLAVARQRRGGDEGAATAQVRPKSTARHR